MGPFTQKYVEIKLILNHLLTEWFTRDRDGHCSGGHREVALFLREPAGRQRWTGVPVAVGSVGKLMNGLREGEEGPNGHRYLVGF